MYKHLIEKTEAYVEDGVTSGLEMGSDVPKAMSEELADRLWFEIDDDNSGDVGKDEFIEWIVQESGRSLINSADRVIKSIQWMWAEIDHVWHVFGAPPFV